MSPTPSPSPHTRPHSRPHSRSHSRQSSLHGRHVNQPSRLRQSHVANSDELPEQSRSTQNSSTDESGTLQNSEEGTGTLASRAATSVRDKVVDGYFRVWGGSGCNSCGNGECEHGLLSPRAWDDSTTGGGHGSYGGKFDSHGGKFDSHGGDTMHSVLGDAVTDGLIGERVGRENQEDDGGIKHTSTTNWLARKHGVIHRRRMYVGQTFRANLVIESPALPLSSSLKNNTSG